MMLFVSIPDQFGPRDTTAMQQQLKYSVYLDEHAEHLYQTLALLDRLPENAPEWDKLSQSERSTYRSQVEASINAMSEATRYEARARAREHVATLHSGPYGKDFSALPFHTQTEIKAIVQTVVDTYSRALEGLFTPLPAFRLAELEPKSEVQS